ncbi:MAG: diaminopimelate decarboxylase [Nitriliruptorales bacterium]|nr:diaminopimelate decarboxylase [Nitriliruptorales bacterium]
MTRPFPRGAVIDNGRLTGIGGVDVRSLASEFGTPLYVVDEAELVGRMREYRGAFGEGATVAYASKALCVTGVLQLAAAEGLSVDVASRGELYTAQRASFPMERVIFHGNNKAPAELRDAVDLGVGRVVVDSLTELERLTSLARDAGREVDVLVRITPGVNADTHTHIATGHDEAKFGLSLAAGLAHTAIDQVLKTDGLRLAGLHSHVGSQLLTSAAFEAVVRTLIVLLGDIHRRHGVWLEELNVGGGLAIAYTPYDPEPSITQYAAALLDSVDQEAKANGVPAPRITVEPGRSIAGPAGITLYTVGTVKDVPGVVSFAAVDGGMSDNVRPSLYGARYEVVPAGAPSPPRDARPFDVVGKHCESGDVIAAGVWLPADLREGDLLAVAATGAYGYSMASNYNRLARPAMVLVGDGHARLLVTRETTEDLVAHDVVL